MSQANDVQEKTIMDEFEQIIVAGWTLGEMDDATERETSAYVAGTVEGIIAVMIEVGDAYARPCPECGFFSCTRDGSQLPALPGDDEN